MEKRKIVVLIDPAEVARLDELAWRNRQARSEFARQGLKWYCDFVAATGAPPAPVEAVLTPGTSAVPQDGG